MAKVLVPPRPTLKLIDSVESGKIVKWKDAFYIVFYGPGGNKIGAGLTSGGWIADVEVEVLPKGTRIDLEQE